MLSSQHADLPPPAAATLVDVRRLRKAFGSDVVLSDLELTVDGGERVCIIGPSG